jgi:hypothetical protein
LNNFECEGQLVITSGQLNFNASANVSATGSIEIDGDLNTGNMGGSGDVTIGGTLIWRGGTITGTGLLTINPGAFFDINGDAYKSFDTRTINNNGAAVWTGTAGLHGLAGGVWNNNGTLNSQSDAAFGSDFADQQPVFNNAGTYVKSIGTGTSLFINCVFNQIGTGTIDIQTGTLAFANAAFNTQAGTTILGSGTLDVSGIAFTNAGIVNPGTSPGTLTVTGDYPQASTGVINIELGGTAAGTEYDVLSISGDATFAGTLNVSLIEKSLPMVPAPASLIPSPCPPCPACWNGA